MADLNLFPDDQVVGVFRGFREGGMEFHADLALPYRTEFHNTPMHGQFLLVQLETPDSMRGRVSAINSLFIGTSNQLGEFESGVTAALFGTVPAVVLGGAGTLAVVALWVVRFPTLAKRDRLVPESHAPQT